MPPDSRTLVANASRSLSDPFTARHGAISRLNGAASTASGDYSASAVTTIASRPNRFGRRPCRPHRGRGRCPVRVSQVGLEVRREQRRPIPATVVFVVTVIVHTVDARLHRYGDRDEGVGGFVGVDSDHDQLATPIRLTGCRRRIGAFAGRPQSGISGRLLSSHTNDPPGPVGPHIKTSHQAVDRGSKIPSESHRTSPG